MGKEDLYAKPFRERSSWGQFRYLIGLFVFIMLFGSYLMALLASFISPLVWALPSFFALLYPFILVAVLLYIPLAMLLKHWRRAMLIGLLLCGSFPFVLYYFPLNKPLKNINQENSFHLKILSYNVAAFQWKTHSQSNPNHILQYLKDCNADIICMQEAVFPKSKGNWIDRKVLKNYFNDYKYYDERLVQKGRSSRLVILSRYPLRWVQRIPTISKYNGSIAYSIDINQDSLLIVNNHLESFNIHGADLHSKGDIQHREKKIRSVLKNMLKKYRLTARQVIAIKSFINKYPHKNCIILGDFNDTPLSYTLASFRRMGFVDSFAERGTGLGASFIGMRHIFRIDHILHSQNILCSHCQIHQDITHSDHHPIEGEFYLTKENT